MPTGNSLSFAREKGMNSFSIKSSVLSSSCSCTASLKSFSSTSDKNSEDAGTQMLEAVELLCFGKRIAYSSSNILFLEFPNFSLKYGL